MACEEIQRVISDGDRRALRGASAPGPSSWVLGLPAPLPPQFPSAARRCSPSPPRSRPPPRPVCYARHRRGLGPPRRRRPDRRGGRQERGRRRRRGVQQGMATGVAIVATAAAGTAGIVKVVDRSGPPALEARLTETPAGKGAGSAGSSANSPRNARLRHSARWSGEPRPAVGPRSSTQRTGPGGGTSASRGGRARRRAFVDAPAHQVSQRRHVRCQGIAHRPDEPRHEPELPWRQSQRGRETGRSGNAVKPERPRRQSRTPAAATRTPGGGNPNAHGRQPQRRTVGNTERTWRQPQRRGWQRQANGSTNAHGANPNAHGANPAGGADGKPAAEQQTAGPAGWPTPAPVLP